MTEARYLADTHILLWALNDDKRLTEKHRKILQGSSPVMFSVAAIWEITIKRSLGKLTAPPGLIEILEHAGYLPLNITPRHAEAVANLPLLHGDPFDRLLIAQARVEDLVLMTADEQFAAYDVAVI